MNKTVSTLEIHLSRRIWRVTRDGVFYGDYRTRRYAEDSAEAAAAVLRAQRREVRIVAPLERA